MHWQRTLHPARTVARIGHWLLPWTCVLLVSGSIAQAIEQPLARAVPEPPVLPVAAMNAPADPTAATRDASCAARDGGTQHVGLNAGNPADPQGQPCLRPPARPGSRWVGLESVAPNGSTTSLTCLTSADRVSTDVLSVRAEELAAVVVDLCSELWP